MKNPKYPTRRRRIMTVLISLAVIFVIIQFIRPSIDKETVPSTFNGPPEVAAILKRACYDCHSNDVNLRWYDKIQPVYWLVSNHIREGREGLNFSAWSKMAAGDQKGKLWESFNQIMAGAMPLKSYEAVHPETKLSNEDIAILKNYVTSLAVKHVADSTLINDLNKQSAAIGQAHAMTASLPTAANGVAFIPDYKNWQEISSTERFDNGTMRVILGNSIAIDAVKHHQTNPWPNGTTFAKVAWDQVEDANGVVKTGAFKQIEFMIKDDKKYASTKGWGWARFKTLKLLPYGKNLTFTTECINCHRPQAAADFVFTTAIK